MIVTKQQLKYLRLAADGYTTAQIAKQVYLSERTVKGHLHAARDALGARNTTQAVAIAITGGLITTEISQDLSVRVALTRITRALGYDLDVVSCDSDGGAR